LLPAAGRAAGPAAAPARLRRHVDTADGVRAVDAALHGGLAGWIGPWRSAGFVTPRWALRDFTPVGELPAGYGSPAVATAAVDPGSGRVGRLLVTTGAQADPPQLIGVLTPGTALIRARGEAGMQHLIAWRIASGRLYLVATVDAMASVSVADLGPAG
jgi:hypothetical protein